MSTSDLDDANYSSRSRNVRQQIAPQIETLRLETRKRIRDEADELSERMSGRKRARATQACDQCRRRKERCDSQQPSCGYCLSMGVTCNYSPTRKRGLRTGQLRSLEILLGLVFQSIEGSESWIYDLLQGLPSTKPSFKFRVPPAATSRDAMESLLDSCRKSSVLSQAEQLLSMTEQVEDENDTTDTFESRLANTLKATINLPELEDDALDSIVISHAPISPVNTDGRSILDASVGASELIPNSNTPQGAPIPSNLVADTPSSVLEALATHRNADVPPGIIISTNSHRTQLPAQWPRLVDIYFSNTHCWFPICQKHDLLRTAHTYSMTNSVDSPSSGESAFLWAVLAYSSLHADTSEALQYSMSEYLGHEDISATARSLLSLEQYEYDIGHVRAFLLLALLRIEQGRWDSAWVAVGQAIYIASCQDNLSRVLRQASRNIEDGGRRILLGCFALETLIATRLQKRTFFQRSDIQAIGLLSQDGIEEWEPLTQQTGMTAIPRPLTGSSSPGRILSIFNQFIELMSFLNDLLKFEENISQSLHQELVWSLKVWKGRLPSHFQAPVDPSMSPQLLNLHLAYATVSEALGVFAHAEGQGRQIDLERWDRILHLSMLFEERNQDPGLNTHLFVSKTYLPLLDGSLKLRELRHEDVSTRRQINKLRSLLRKLEDFRPGSQRRPLSLTDIQQQFPVPLPRADDQDSKRAPPQRVGLARQIPISFGEEQEMNSQFPAVESLTGSTEFATDIDLMSLEDPVPQVETGENALFESLTMLDTADWIANPPQFMRHLGILGPTAPDLHTFLGP